MKPFTQILILLTFLSFSLSGCKNEKFLLKKELEMAVFYKVFPQFLDSLKVENYLLWPPPPPPPQKEFQRNVFESSQENGKELEALMPSKEMVKRMEAWKTNLDSVKKETAEIYIAIQDSLISFRPDEFNNLMAHFPEEIIVRDSRKLGLKQRLRINLEKLYARNPKIKLKYRSEFPEGAEMWSYDGSFKPLLLLAFTRILFDETKTFGVFTAGVSRGKLNSQGYRVFIRKDKVKGWVIDEIRGTWFS